MSEIEEKAQKTPEPSKPWHRPSIYSLELAHEFCARMEQGRSLRQICRDDDMPCTATITKWNRENPEFAELYAKARECLLEYWAEEIIEIADDGSNDWIKVNDPENTGYRVNGEHVARSRLRVDQRKWILSKLMPKKYGDRLTAEVSGPNGGPIETKMTLDVSKLNDEQLRAIGSIPINER